MTDLSALAHMIERHTVAGGKSTWCAMDLHGVAITLVRAEVKRMILTLVRSAIICYLFPVNLNKNPCSYIYIQYKEQFLIAI